MCLLALSFQQLEDAPVAVAANREEYFARASWPPAVQTGRPRVLCGTDARAGGTWLGVNEFGLVVAVTNRGKRSSTSAPRSRGLLCRELLDCSTAAAAADQARNELASGRYDGANFLCADGQCALVVHGGDLLEVIPLPPGLHLLTNGDVNDEGDPRQRLARELFAAARPASADEFVTAARGVCSYRQADNSRSIVLREDDRGTVSSTIVVITGDPRSSACHYSAGPPDRTAYEDLSSQLQNLAQEVGWD